MSDTQSEFGDLLEAIQSLAARRKPLEARLQAIEEKRSTTAPAIYERVRKETAEALAQLQADGQASRTQALALRTRLDSERSVLEKKVTQLTEELEELRFRKTLGEYSDGDFAKIERERATVVADTRAQLQPFEEMSSVLDPFLEASSAPPPIASPAPAPAVREISEMESLFASGSGASQKAVSRADSAHDREISAPIQVAANLSPRLTAVIRPVLVVRSKDQDRSEDNYELANGPTLIGRAPENDIILLEESVSRRHARIQVQGGECTVEDLGSANGSYLNGARLAPKAPQPLRDNDVLKLGQLIALFRLHPDD